MSVVGNDHQGPFVVFKGLGQDLTEHGLAALGGVLLVTALRMVEVSSVRALVRISRGDALVLLEDPTFPGCWVTARPVGVFWMEDEKGPDAKIICVPPGEPRWDTIDDLDS